MLQQQEQYNISLASEQERAQQALREAVATAVAAETNRRQGETEALLSTLSADKEHALSRALEAKEVELRKTLADAASAAEVFTSEAVARAVARAVAEADLAAEKEREKTLAEALSIASAKAAAAFAEERAKAEGFHKEALRTMASAEEERLARMSTYFSAERQRLRDAVDAVTAERDAALGVAAREGRLREEAREGHERAMEEAREMFVRGRDQLVREGRREMDEAVARAGVEGEGEAARKLEEAFVERGREDVRRAVEAAVARKDREMAKALKVKTSVLLFFFVFTLIDLVIASFFCFFGKALGVL